MSSLLYRKKIRQIPQNVLLHLYSTSTSTYSPFDRKLYVFNGDAVLLTSTLCHFYKLVFFHNICCLVIARYHLYLYLLNDELGFLGNVDIDRKLLEMLIGFFQ
jgi:hypothetical protein